ncbi:MAG: hypothetical protein JXR83_00315 [Deltaproteobacteria bacterium]|nr:hypothetical protein [Deltaproteobacteria bacterium]
MSRLSGQFVFALALAACQPPQVVPADAHVDKDGGILTCTVDDQCPLPLRCIGGLCLDRECESKEMCPAGQICRDGYCIDPPEQCSGPEDCPGQLVCEGFSRTCIDPYQGACITSFDCEGQPGCENGCNCSAAGTCVPIGQDAAVPPRDAGSPPADSGGPDRAPIPDAGSAADTLKPDLGGYDTRRRDAASAGRIDLTGYRIENREHSPPQLSVIPAGIGLEPGQMLIVGRFSGEAEFELYWGVDLGADVVYITNADANRVPMVNGGEKWALTDPGGSVIVDGVTIAGAIGNSYQRITADSASYQSSWSALSDTDATPGSTSLPGSGVGLVISEWSDASGTGHYIYEFIEIYYAP